MIEPPMLLDEQRSGERLSVPLEEIAKARLEIEATAAEREGKA